ncbi:uncharacterized protein LOC122015942 [Zingiber officinale]|uniref:uncharacterized protein LOC122015942 n=1 Tax=Zingiber officinale TaxID=94328 RepID=UPI001C4A9A9D|nr:uncharacterized protein LOC122015942 [Zingiber officinale]
MEGAKERKEVASAENKAAPPQEEATELPTESSPYVTYKDLEDYKMKGYGAAGHRQPVDKPGGGGGTDAPTLAGKDLSATAADR